jgi:hypothetical protein|tara:strand:- start:1245 stop:1418 length:174 start_codon:yes stop_codon:yes gene_type:complete
MYIIGCFWMMLSASVCSVFAFLHLLEYGTPFMGMVLFVCGVCFAGGWAAIAKEFCDG